MATLNQGVASSRGICSACMHGAVCIYPRNKGQIVLNCEQFEPCPPIASPTANRDQVELEKLWKKSSGDETGREFKGLCSNCMDRHACIYPKPVGGVWRCDEYR